MQVFRQDSKVFLSKYLWKCVHLLGLQNDWQNPGTRKTTAIRYITVRAPSFRPKFFVQSQKEQKLIEVSGGKITAFLAQPSCSVRRVVSWRDVMRLSRCFGCGSPKNPLKRGSQMGPHHADSRYNLWASRGNLRGLRLAPIMQTDAVISRHHGGVYGVSNGSPIMPTDAIISRTVDVIFFQSSITHSVTHPLFFLFLYIFSNPYHSFQCF